jgi:hypothetical protein
MKKIIFSVAFLIIGSIAFAQDGPQNVIKANILSPILKSGSFFYERALNEKSSFQLGVGFTAYKEDESGVKISGFFITPEYRMYLSANKTAPAGFYAAPFLRYQNLKIEDEFDKATLTTFGGGVVAGHQWIFRERFSLDMFLGPNYNSGNVKITSGSQPDIPTSFKGFGIRTGVTFGLAF